MTRKAKKNDKLAETTTTIVVSPTEEQPLSQNKTYKDQQTEKAKPPALQMIAFSNFFRFLTGRDKALMIIGTCAAVITGVLLPSLSIIMGEITNTFDPDNSAEDIKDTMATLSGYIAIVGLGTWVFGYIYFSFWQHLAENITFNLRSRYLHAILK